MSEIRRVLFLSWGRRGAMTQFALDLIGTARAMPGLAATLSISRQNQAFAAFQPFAASLLPIDTFATHAGALGQAWRIPGLRHRLARHVAEQRIAAVIELMPHVWSPFVLPALRGAGAALATVIHDADAHPGDRTSLVKGLLDRAMRHADVVLTLSDAVAARLAAGGHVAADRVVALRHPDLRYGAAQPSPESPPGGHGAPLRLLFLGRILPYKGLPLLVEAVESLRAEGLPVTLGVYGEGDLGAAAPRLAALGATVVNRWLTEAEIGPILARHDAMVLSHVEASQSGVAAAALGAGLPLIATPVGGLVEQVIEGRTGVLAARADAPALAAAIRRLATDAALAAAIRSHVAAGAAERSMARFIADSVAATLAAARR
jgi:glycosyltransferase involved in cell wall biosynthesis